MKPLKTELAWAAGLFDGEGWIGINKLPSGHYLRMALMSTSKELVDRFHSTIGVGKINGPYIVKDHKPAYQWRASSKEAEQVIELLSPYLADYSLSRIESAKQKVWRKKSKG